MARSALLLDSTLLDVRKEFVRASGRFDLVENFESGDFTDRGANTFLNAGFRLLDNLIEGLGLKNWFAVEVAAGDSFVGFQRARWIDRVRVSDSAETSTLERKALDWLENNFTLDPSATSRGRPKYWSEAPLGVAPGNDGASAGSFTAGIEELDFTSARHKTRSVIFRPPADKAYTLLLLGSWYTLELTSDSQKNFWTANHPLIAAWAAQYQLEVSMRNREGAADWMSAIRVEIEREFHNAAAGEAMGFAPGELVMEG